MIYTKISVSLLVLVVLCAAVSGHPREVIYIPMSDGNSLEADLYRPETGLRYPVILIQTPYGKWRFFNNLPFETDNYATVIVDWRGYGANSDVPKTEGSKLGKDGKDCVEWIATVADWCDGNVGTWGSSALGVAQFSTAVEQPEHLKCCVPQFSSLDMGYDHFYTGGVLLKEKTDFYFLMGYFNEQLLLEHYTDDGFWALLALQREKYDRIKVPMLLVTGWYEHEAEEKPRTFNKLIAQSDESVKDKHRMLIGPWTHASEDTIYQGELEYPAAEAAAAARAIEFFDRYMRGIEPENEYPKVTWYQLGSDEWMYSDTYPATALDEPLKLYFDTGGILGNDQPVGSESYSEFVYDPAEPVQSLGGPRLSTDPDVITGPADIRELEHRADVLTFSTAPLERDIAVFGIPKVTLYVSTNTLDTDFMVWLTDVYPDGRSMFIVDGARRCRFRTGYEPGDETLMPADLDTVVEIEIEMGPTAVTFLKGHRVRVNVSSSNFPRFHVNANDGTALYDDEEFPTISTNRIHHGGLYGTRIEIPRLCPYPDFECDGTVDYYDFTRIAADWLSDDPNSDFNYDGLVDTADLVKFASYWLYR